MNSFKSFHLAWVLAGIVLIISSCVKEEYDFNTLSKEISLSPKFVLPALTGSLTLGDSFEPKEDTIVVNPDGTIKLMYRQDSLFTYSVTDIIDMPDQTPHSKTATLGSVYIDDFSYDGSLTLNVISLNFDAGTRSTLLARDGTNDIFPPVPPPNTGNFNMTPFSNFTQVMVDSGKISIGVTNQLPVEVSFTLILRNTSDNSQVGTAFVYTAVPSMGSQTQIVDVSGNLTNDLNFDIVDFTSPGSSGNVDVDLTDLILISLSSQNMVVSSGTAILPDQVFFIETDTIDTDVDPGTEITYVEMASGDIDYNITSGFNENIQVNLILPTGELNEDTLKYAIPVLSGGSASGTLSMAGASIDFSIDPGQPYNKLPFKFMAEIASTGSMVSFNFADAFTMDYTMSNLDFDYLEGYFGEQNYSIDLDSLEIDLGDIFDKITGTITFTDPKINIPYTNSIGVPANLEVDLWGETSAGERQDLNAPMVSIDKLEDRDDPLVESSMEFNRDNSSIVELIELRPEILYYSGDVNINPDGATGLRDNFVLSASEIIGDLEVEIPASLKVQNLSLRDTTDNPFYPEDPGDESDLSKLEEITLYFSATNGFPLEIDFKIIPYDTVNNIEYPAIDVPQFITAAPVDANGRVNELIQAPIVKIELDKTMLENLEKSERLIVQAWFKTTGDGAREVIFYTDYTFEFKLAVGLELNIE